MDQVKSQFFTQGDVSISSYLLAHYRDLGMTNDEFLLYVQLKNQLEHAQNINLSTISHSTGWSTSQLNQIIDQLRTKNFINLVSLRDEAGKVTTSIDFSPLYVKIIETEGIYSHSTAGQRVESQGEVFVDTASQNDQPTRTDIFNLIEQEFGRPLSSIELQTVKDWFDIDHFRPDFIKAALQEAVMNNALSLRYIETILVAWQKKNYHSLNEIQTERKSRQQYKAANPETLPKVATDVDLYNLDLGNL